MEIFKFPVEEDPVIDDSRVTGNVRTAQGWEGPAPHTRFTCDDMRTTYGSEELVPYARTIDERWCDEHVTRVRDQLLTGW